MPPLFQKRMTCSAEALAGSAWPIRLASGIPRREALKIFNARRRVRR